MTQVNTSLMILNMRMFYFKFWNHWCYFYPLHLSSFSLHTFDSSFLACLTNLTFFLSFIFFSYFFVKNIIRNIFPTINYFFLRMFSSDNSDCNDDVTNICSFYLILLYVYSSTLWYGRTGILYVFINVWWTLYISW